MCPRPVRPWESPGPQVSLPPLWIRAPKREINHSLWCLKRSWDVIKLREACWGFQKMGQVKAISVLMKSRSTEHHTCTLSISAQDPAIRKPGCGSRVWEYPPRRHSFHCSSPALLIYLDVLHGLAAVTFSANYLISAQFTAVVGSK